MKLEHTILSGLVYDESYLRKVYPYLRRDYFSDQSEIVTFELIKDFVDKYNTCPSKESLSIDLSQKEGVSEAVFKQAKELIDAISTPIVKQDWLIDRTEEFCQDKALYNAALNSIKIMDEKDGKVPRTAIPSLFQEALGVSFDSKLGHDYLDDAESRYDFYHSSVSRMPFDIEMLNKVTKGGIPPKTLNILLSPTNVGKTLMMCHFGYSYLRDGKNVLYITLEMAEERISERVDANLLNIDLDDMARIDKESFLKKIEMVKQKTTGRFKVVEYPTASAGAANFRHLLSELKLKQNFVPDIIFIDYINLCISSRIKPGGSANSFTIVKAIAEELRGLAVEFNVPIWTGTQVTRSGLSNSDLDLEDVSESIALASTCDFMLGVTQSEEMAELNQYMFKQLKSRYGDKNKHKRFVVGVDKGKMRLFDVDPEEAGTEDKPLMDKTSFGQEDFQRRKPKSKFGNKAKFGEFK